MNLQEIKTAVDNGLTVHCGNSLYEVRKVQGGTYVITCTDNGYTIGLTGLAGTKYESVLNGAEKDFYIQKGE